jgi:hypothetical protein
MWPTTRAAITLLQSFVPDPTKFRGITQYLPLDVVTQTDSEAAHWEVLGPMLGLLPAYGGGRSRLIRSQVLERKSISTAYWRGNAVVEEREINRIASISDPSRQRLAAKELIARKLLNLSIATDRRLEWLVWKALDNMLNTFDDNGVKFSLDYDLPEAKEPDNYWDDFAAATPIADFQNEIREFLGTGVSSVDVVYNGNVELLISQNESIADKVGGTNWVGNTGTADVMQLLKRLIQGEGESGSTGPRIREMVCYDEGYHDESGTFQLFLPDDTVFLIGQAGPEYAEEGGPSDRGTVGATLSTPVMHQDFDSMALAGDPRAGLRPGKFVTIDDQTKVSPKQVVCEGGINAVPAIKRPTWIRRIRVKERA